LTRKKVKGKRKEDWQRKYNGLIEKYKDRKHNGLIEKDKTQKEKIWWIAYGGREI
jgi:hypothetical protein